MSNALPGGDDATSFVNSNHARVAPSGSYAEVMVAHARTAMALLDGEGRVLCANAAFESLIGREGQSLRALEEDSRVVTTAIAGIGALVEVREDRRERSPKRGLSLLLHLSDSMRESQDPSEIMRLATRTIGSFLGVSYCAIVTANPEGGPGRVEHAWPGGVPETPGIETDALLKSGKTSVSERGIRCPVLFRGHLVAFIDVRSDTSRTWLAEEIEFAEQVTHRCWAEIQRVQADAERREAYEATLEGWSRTLDARDHETLGHSRRVAELALQLASRLDYPEEKMEDLERGALIHDIGKVGVPEDVLQKAGPLTESERDAIKRHPEIALEMLASIRFLQPALEIPYVHHERWDGTGYPRGLRGEEIPLSARIFAVVDVYDALTSERPYRPAWPAATALAYIDSQAGRHFDPDVATAFVEMKLEELERPRPAHH